MTYIVYTNDSSYMSLTKFCLFCRISFIIYQVVGQLYYSFSYEIILSFASNRQDSTIKTGCSIHGFHNAFSISVV